MGHRNSRPGVLDQPRRVSRWCVDILRGRQVRPPGQRAARRQVQERRTARARRVIPSADDYDRATPSGGLQVALVVSGPWTPGGDASLSRPFM